MPVNIEMTVNTMIIRLFLSLCLVCLSIWRIKPCWYVSCIIMSVSRCGRRRQKTE